MIRLFALVVAALVLGGSAAGTAAAAHETRTALGPPVARATAGVSVSDGAGGSAIVRAPAGASVLAAVGGVPALTADGDVVLDGLDDDMGVTVTYSGIASASTGGMVERGAVLGQVGSPGLLTVRATLDGQPLDAAPLLRAALALDSRNDWHEPVDGAVVSQPFGCTSLTMEPRDPHCATGHMHTGIDLAAPLGTAVRAALSGVAHVVVSSTGYGLHVVVDSGGGLSTLYAHLSALSVHDGDPVAAGDVIGAVGSTGNSTGPHLHFEVRRDGIPEDPALDIALP